jgi:glucose-6-phosphate 1-dehydrogenase
MNPQHSDAFVFFGATGDLADKKIFPSLQAMVKRGHLNVPVIGVARSAKDLGELRAQARWTPTNGCWGTPWQETGLAECGGQGQRDPQAVRGHP